MITEDEGSRDENRKCACDLDAGYYDYDYSIDPPDPNGPHFCQQVSCEAGFELHENGMLLFFKWFVED